MRTIKNWTDLGGGSADVNPGFGEEGTRSQHEDNVDDSVYRIGYDMTYRLRRGQVVTQTSNRISLITTFLIIQDVKNI